MIYFDKPENLNGAELRQQLRNAGVNISDDMFAVELNADNKLGLDIDLTDKAKAAAVVAAHNGTTVAPEPTIADKLASVGLSLDELKAAILGGN